MFRCPHCDNVISEVPLVAACDMLVIRALELVGKRIVRVERSRYKRMDGRPWHEAHLLWQPDDRLVDKALEHAWDSVDLVLTEYGTSHLKSVEIKQILNRYVRDLLRSRTGHDLRELRYRLGAYLGEG